MDAVGKKLEDLCRNVLRPLIEADHWKLYLVAATHEELTLHLGGTCAGCPGASMTVQTLIEPAVRTVSPSTKVVVTVGTTHPEDAVLLEADVPVTVRNAMTR